MAHNVDGKASGASKSQCPRLFHEDFTPEEHARRDRQFLKLFSGGTGNDDALLHRNFSPAELKELEEEWTRELPGYKEAELAEQLQTLTNLQALSQGLMVALSDPNLAPSEIEALQSLARELTRAFATIQLTLNQSGLISRYLPRTAQLTQVAPPSHTLDQMVEAETLGMVTADLETQAESDLIAAESQPATVAQVLDIFEKFADQVNNDLWNWYQDAPKPQDDYMHATAATVAQLEQFLINPELGQQATEARELVRSTFKEHFQQMLDLITSESNVAITALTLLITDPALDEIFGESLTDNRLVWIEQAINAIERDTLSDKNPTRTIELSSKAPGPKCAIKLTELITTHRPRLAEQITITTKSKTLGED